MAVTTEQVQVQVEINGIKAGTTIKDLENSAKQLRKELKVLPVDTEEFVKKANELQKVNTQLKAMTDNVKAVDKSLEDVEKHDPFKELEESAKALRSELRNLPPGTEAFLKKAAELQKVNTELKKINDSVKAVDKSLEDTGKSGGFFKNALSGAFSVFTGGALKDLAEEGLGMVKDFLVGGVEDAKNAARSYAQLEAALHGNVEATKALNEQADGLEKSLRGVFEAEAIQDAQARLAIYTQEKDQIEALIPQILDLAAAKGTDLATAADAVGRSLSGNGDALSKLGVSVKDAATEEERFATITQGLTDAVGGQAKALADSKTSAWDSLKISLGDIGENIGAKLIPIINNLGEFLVTLWNKSQPVVDVFKTIFGVFGQVWDSIKQLIASFGIFSDKASLAETIMKTLAAAMKPMQMAWQGISYAIKGVSTALNELVAGANGTVQAMVAIFSNFKTFFSNLFGSIGDVIKGVFKLDADTIKSGIAGMKASFTSMGGQIAEAYNKGYTDVRNRQKEALKTEEEKEHKANVATATKRAKEKTQAEIDAENKARQKAKEDQEKADEKEQQRRAALSNRLLQLQQQVEDMKISIMQDGRAKDEAAENARFEREKQNIANQINELRQLGASEIQIREQYHALTEASEAKHLDNMQDIFLKYHQGLKPIVVKTWDDIHKEQITKYNKQIDATNEFYDSMAVGMKGALAKKLQAENLSADQIKREQENTNAALLQLEITKLEETLAIQKQYAQSTIETENALAEKRIELAQRTADQRKAIEDAMMQTVQEGLEFAIEALSQDEAARKKNADLLKAFNIAKITLDLYREIQGIWASVSELGPIIGPIVGGVQSALAIGRSVLAVSKMKSVKYAAGGYTGDGVDIIDGTGERVAGVVHEQEWIAPKWMNTHPVYHNIINHLEGVRQRGFAAGGFTTTPVNNISTNVDLMGTENKLDQLINAFKEFPTRLKADVVYTEFETVEQNVNDVRNAAQVGK